MIILYFWREVYIIGNFKVNTQADINIIKFKILIINI